MKVNQLLLHCCCAPCSIMCIETLRAEGIVPALFWYNPNIHPYTEYESRRGCLTAHARREGLDLVTGGGYGLLEFLSGLYKEGKTSPERPGRCAYCYRIRLENTAREAKERGFDAFSTTLLISPYQNHELLRETGEAAAKRNGVEFVYRDFRPFFRAGQAKAREGGYYRQKYCGCIYSEEERYTNEQ